MIGGVAMLALVAGGTACSSGSDDEASGGSACGSKIAFFGALTGSSAALGINEKNGVKLAVDKYNKENADCKVELAELDSQGSPDQAPGLARRRSTTPRSWVSWVRPTRASPRPPARCSTGRPGHHHPSATRPSLAEQGWKTFFRAVGNDLSQGPAAGNYIKNVMKADRVYVIDDQSAYGAGLADEVRRFSAPRSWAATRSRARQADRVLRCGHQGQGRQRQGGLLRRLLPGGRPDP
ncbi:hypothetical protein V2I01_01515 [Micromonospora sp. BRA006-A]|nr:hypothetical protein [Micromonospora sp. BRA006-A]